ncbi:phage major capsid protein [Bradyrhizobium sp. CCH5-F6]|uniref:phage major capsid protein n=1 Tax=Bradyrhizobium sp. CCH5-F6 TaxID=1768753 RepID=UPI000769F231|nr:phage major capsid protein [Bradyrhizobium sp. CCH5-F6]
MPETIEDLLKKQGEAFDAFQKSHDEQIKELKSKGGANDPVLVERLSKIEKSLDAAVEAKAAIEAAVKAEKAEREALELKLNRVGLKNDENGKLQLELKEFNHVLNAVAIDRRRPFTPLDAKGYEDYKSAFDSFARGGREMLTADEVKTLSVGSDPDGGVWVTPDTTGGIVKKVYETSPVRQYASVRTISTDALEGIEDLGEAGVGYAGEHGTSGDTTTPQVGEWKIPVFNLDTEPKATQNLLDDASIDIEGWLMEKVGAKFGRFENSEFITGAANKIRGFVNGYTVAADSGSGVTWGTIGYLATGVSGDFAASAKGDKLYDLMGLLKNEYLINAAWFTRRSVITAIRKFKDGQGNYLWQPSFIAGQPETIMGYPVVRMEDMPALGADSLSLAFGDLKQAYQVVDRQGIRVLRDNLTSKPYTKFYTTKRTGGGVVNFEAIKLMKFGTS